MSHVLRRMLTLKDRTLLGTGEFDLQEHREVV